MDDGAADEVIAVFVRDQPLIEVMNALWSLVSYRGAEWRWRRVLEAGAYRYHLARPPEAQALPAELRRETQQAFEMHAGRLLQAVDLPEHQRRGLFGGDPAAETWLSDDRARSALRIFRDGLDRETQGRILRGGPGAEVPLNVLAPEARAWIEEVVAGTAPRIRVDGGEWQQLRTSLPTHVTFFSDWGGSRMAPALSIAIPRSSHLPDGQAMQSTRVLGTAGGRPLEEHFLVPRLLNRWHVIGDRERDPRGRAPLPPLEELSLRELWDRLPARDRARLAREGHEGDRARIEQQLRASERDPLQRRLADLAARKGIPVLARVPPGDVLPVPAPAAEGRTIDDYLGAIATLGHKWRRDFLLVTYLGWFMEDQHWHALHDDRTIVRVPWAVVREARADAEEAEDGILQLDRLASYAVRFSPAELRLLADHLPALQQAAQQRHSYLRFYGHMTPGLQRRVRDEAGVRLAELRPLVERLADERLSGFLTDSERAEAFRVVEADEGDVNARTYRVRFQVLDALGEVVRQDAVTQRGRPSRLAPPRRPAG